MKSARASVEGRALDLVFGTTTLCSRTAGFCQPGWVGTLSLAGLARGGKTLTVSATDVFGNAGRAERRFIYDQPPALTVAAPLSETVARPSVFVDAACTDDDPAGCASLTVEAEHRVQASGKATLRGDISLAAFERLSMLLVFKATDSGGQVTSISRRVHVESNANLSEVESVGGRIVDVQPDRILFVEDTEAGLVLKIHDRVSGRDAVVSSTSVGFGQMFLSPEGAVFEKNNETDVFSSVFEWRDGALRNLDPLNSGNSLKVRGKYAIWNSSKETRPPDGKLLILRDLAAGTQTVVSDAGAGVSDVTAGGDVVYSIPERRPGTGDPSASNVFRYRGGVTTKLTDDSNVWNISPRTDGINVAYVKATPCCSPLTFALLLHRPAGAVTLAPPGPWEISDHRVEGGWVAFSRPGANGLFQVWRRSPADAEERLSFFNASSFVEALSPKGGVVFSAGGHTFLKEPDSPLVEIRGARGRDFWQNEQWLVVIGRTLFRVNTVPEPAPTLLTEDGSPRAVALNAASLARDPFTLFSPQNLSPDRRLRVMLLAANLRLLPGEDASAVLVQAEDSRHRLFPLPVEFVGKVPNFDWLTQITVSLPDELEGAGDVWVSVSLRGVSSNRALIKIQP
ncbi:MAG: hypothetical protein M3416_02035 [Acidobacteriota bacterium]|nr:hypothetical protein [Acidobacteriota bacterium]